MKLDLGNLKPSCEQAKFIAQSARLIGIGLMALVGTRLATGYIDGKDTMAQEILLLIVFAEWVGLEYVGYLIIGKGGC
ncbi:hypothetical protein HF670_07695 [Acidithiobacillus thiooxidans]|uniref:hypothetical protein n=1 Tax=Acidithiobacillus thiooxidans TaxID=930 RepID=UPI001C07BFDA|nr:hypothetical protein [Acidithiobacillus thiooxidans]MBU2839447.1 hypothetical protein [Acidithiobacillus thiooxidans]